MTGHEKRIDEISGLLKASYQKRQAPVLDQAWRDGIMREVRGLAAEGSGAAGWLERLFPAPMLFRFAGASGVAAALAVVFLASQGGLSADVFKLIASDPSGLLQLALLAL